jgi:hypothetical protein
LPLEIDAPNSWHTLARLLLTRAQGPDLCQFTGAFCRFSCSVCRQMRPATVAGLSESRPIAGEPR